MTRGRLVLKLSLGILAIVAILVFGMGMLMIGGVVLFEVPVTLAVGWINFLGRVLPQLNPDPWTISTAIVSLVGVVLGGHYFFRWLAGERWPWLRTLRMVGLVVLAFTAGIAMVGMTHQTAWLARSPESLFDGGGRSITARANSSNNLKQIMIAAEDVHDHAQPPGLPRSTFDTTGRAMHSWQTALLPYCEQAEIYSQIDQSKPWSHEVNASALIRPIKTFMNPAADIDRVNGYAVSHYTGNAAIVLADRPLTLPHSFPQGTSNTIFAWEVSSEFRAWGDPLNARDPHLAETKHHKQFGARSGSPALFLMLDGSTRTFDPKALQEAAELVRE